MPEAAFSSAFSCRKCMANLLQANPCRVQISAHSANFHCTTLCREMFCRRAGRAFQTASTSAAYGAQIPRRHQWWLYNRHSRLSPVLPRNTLFQSLRARCRSSDYLYLWLHRQLLLWLKLKQWRRKQCFCQDLNAKERQKAKRKRFRPWRCS